MMADRDIILEIEQKRRFGNLSGVQLSEKLLAAVGNPQKELAFIHIAGTNGKGSTAAFLHSVLKEAGIRSGLFTSPHLIDFTERIQVDGEQIGLSDAAELGRRLLDLKLEDEPTMFDYCMAMAMLYFKTRGCKLVVLETGLGGRLDATNSFPSPQLTVITSISLDHTDILGDTIEEIAAEKAGIIKEHVPVFYDGGNEAASAVIRGMAAERGAACREITKNAFKIQEVTRKNIAFSRASAYDRDINWSVPIPGLYQVMNAELAIQSAEYLLRNENIHRELWPEAVASVRWRGRMEEAGDHLIIDGAHNPGALEAFAESVQALPDEGEGLPVVIFSAVTDKKYEQMIEYLCEHFPAKAYVTVQIEDARGVPVKELGQLFRQHTKQKVVECGNAQEAVRAAYRERKGTGYIYCLGSLYLAGEIEKMV